MSKRISRFGLVAAAASGGAILGICATVMGADVAGRLAAAPAMAADSTALEAFNGEDAQVRAREKAFPVSAYENDSTVGGGGAPQRVLVDNDEIRVNLVSFKKGFVRPGSLRRRNDQLLVYIDRGAYTTLKSGDGEPVANPKASAPAPGSSVFHYHDTVVTENRIDADYRVLFIEMKKH